MDIEQGTSEWGTLEEIFGRRFLERFNLSKPFFFFFWPHSVACEILVPRPRIEPTALAVKVQSPNHWTTREFPLQAFSYAIPLSCMAFSYKIVSQIFQGLAQHSRLDLISSFLLPICISVMIPNHIKTTNVLVPWNRLKAFWSQHLGHIYLGIFSFQIGWEVS